MLSYIAASATLGLAIAIPLSSAKLSPRAGGPAFVPIPSTCTVSNPVPESQPTTYLPGPLTADSSGYYAYYSSFGPDADNKTALAWNCLEQCNGLGPTCQGMFWAEDMIVPKGYYGGEGGYPATACLTFTRPLTSDDFVPAPAGQASYPFARNLAC